MKALKNKAILATALSVALAAFGSAAHATSLREAYAAALQNDPTFRAARHERDAGTENLSLARAGLLPQLSASWSASQNTADQTAPNFLGQRQTSHPQYISRSGVLQLRQPILNLESTARYFQAKAQVSYANAQFSAREQDLVLRLVTAYVEAQFAEEQLALNLAQRDTYAEQQAYAQRMFERGEAARTDVLEAQAKHDSAQAAVLEAQDAVINQRNTLAAITGIEIGSVDRLIDGFKARALTPASFNEWRELALARNAEIEAQRSAVESTRQELNRQRAGHTPKVDFVASLSKSDSETLNTLGTESKNRVVGVQVSIPLYSGGYVSAASRQAAANTEKARADLEGKTNQVLVELRKQYSLAQSSVTKIEAFEKAVKSAELAVEATRQSIKGGVRINLDLLNAQQQLFLAKRDLAQARYGYMIAFLRLRNAAGILDGNDLETIASYFAPPK